MLTRREIAKHNTKESCWVIVHGKAYDVTEFAPEHPGGQKIIIKYAGKDATKEFDPVHPRDTLEKYLPSSKHLGPVDLASIASDLQDEETVDELELARLERVKHMPHVSQCYNLIDFEDIARQTMKKTAWAYYSSGADDEITMRENHAAFRRIWFRPKVLVDVSKVDLSTTMLGSSSSVPFYISAAALGKLGNPEGEVVLTRAAYRENLIQMIPTLASCSFDEIVDAKQGDQIQWLQLYVNQDREITRKIVQQAEKRGCRALWITVDAPQLGRREKDMRSKYDQQAASVQDNETPVDRSQGAARAISSFIDPSLSWKDITWFQSITKMAIVLKGIQRAEDAIRAVEYGVDAILLSNHGGRQLDFARPAIEVLPEVMTALRQHGYENKIEVYIDGGIRRGTDILKALCLGAKGVGIARPFLYAMSTYGETGVVRAIQLLKDELEMDMRLIGATKISDLSQSFVDSSSIANHSVVPKDHLSSQAYDKLVGPPFVKSNL
ncbi:FMN-dependent dehydrogenase-domain-containing protein [Lipomyces starkeyi]|uniref:L-lactate dehydrogenase (cytochrome) n=1 Tax=Lipomyces starkeyi NRRL Y-11557 TaxID=675824 RepID=A0A1E3Q6Z0_LIPST|nr:hypothetical protein LIPSTDRAFT_291737 [Lipomyces starkeyi NRRL Y-11557]